MPQPEGPRVNVTDAEQARWAATALQRGLDLSARPAMPLRRRPRSPPVRRAPGILARHFKGARTIPKRRERLTLRTLHPHRLSHLGFATH